MLGLSEYWDQFFDNNRDNEIIVPVTLRTYNNWSWGGGPVAERLPNKCQLQTSASQCLSKNLVGTGTDSSFTIVSRERDAQDKLTS